MKVYIYSEFQKMIEKSGVGRAVYHQRQALARQGIPCVTDKNEADIIHINTVFTGSYRMAKWARKNGKAVVYHAHSTREDFKHSYTGSNALANAFGYWIKKCYQKGDLIITPSDYAKKLLKSYGINQPIEVMSNGIDLDYYKPNGDDRRTFCEKYGYHEDDKIIMAAGLWIERKGILDFAALAEQLPEYQFIWFGESNIHTIPGKIKTVIRKAQPNLKFAGYVSKEELRQAYGACDLFLFPSYEETEGIVVLEALAMKTPLLVRDIPVYDTWLSDDVNSYKAKNLQEFKAKLEQIVAVCPENILKAGYQVAENRCISRVGDQLLNIYREALKISKYREPSQLRQRYKYFISLSK